MRHELDTEIDIDASPEAVWAVLVDLDRYADWNPFIVSASGKVEVGQRLVNRMQPSGGRAMTFKPTVTAVQTASVFEWLGHLGFAGLFDGRHRFELHRTATGTRFVHSEYFDGVLVRLLRKSLDTNTRNGFVAMNNALKARAESSVRSES